MIPEFWKIARPWTPEQWQEIVEKAKKARELRLTGRSFRKSNRELAEIHYWKARGFESRIIYLSEIRGKDLDPLRME